MAAPDGRPFLFLVSVRRLCCRFRKHRIDHCLELIDRNRLAQDRPAPEQGRQQFRTVARRKQKRLAASLDQVGDRIDVEALEIDVEDRKIVLRGHGESAGVPHIVRFRATWWPSSSTMSVIIIRINVSSSTRKTESPSAISTPPSASEANHNR